MLRPLMPCPLSFVLPCLLAAALARRGVQARRPVFQPLHRYLGLAPEAFPGSEEAWAHAVSLPIYPSLGADEVERVAAAAVEAAGR